MTTETEEISEKLFVEKMVAKYRDLLLAAAGLKSVNIDGQTVSYADLEDLYDHWLAKLKKLDGSNAVVKTVNLQGT